MTRERQELLLPETASLSPNERSHARRLSETLNLFGEIFCKTHVFFAGRTPIFCFPQMVVTSNPGITTKS